MTAAETMLRPITPPGGVVHTVDPGPELKRGAWPNFIAMLASNFRGIFTFLVTRLLGPAALGVFSVAWATTDLVSKIGIFGLDDTVITFIARAETSGDRARSRALFRLAVFLGVAQCTVLAAFSIALVRLLGLRKFGPEIAVIVGMGASGIVALSLAASLFRRAGAHAAGFSYAAESRRLLTYAAPISAYDLLNSIIVRLDVIMLGCFVGRAPGVTLITLGIYAAAVEVAGGLRKINQAFNPIFAPVVAEIGRAS